MFVPSTTNGFSFRTFISLALRCKRKKIIVRSFFRRFLRRSSNSQGLNDTAKENGRTEKPVSLSMIAPSVLHRKGNECMKLNRVGAPSCRARSIDRSILSPFWAWTDRDLLSWAPIVLIKTGTRSRGRKRSSWGRIIRYCIVFLFLWWTAFLSFTECRFKPVSTFLPQDSQ